MALEGHFAALLPELVWRHTPEQFAALAEAALKPKEAAPTEVGLAHLHGSTVSVKEQAEILGLRLQLGTPLSFRALIADAESTLVVVARFLALLEMFRDKVVAFDQLLPLGDLTVHWTAAADDVEQRKPERRIRGTAVSATIAGSSQPAGTGTADRMSPTSPAAHAPPSRRC